jgi:hypothetical protein
MTSAYSTFLSTNSDLSHHATSPTPDYRLEMTIILLGYPDFQVIDEPHENGKLSPIKIGNIVIFNCDPSWRYEVMGLAKFMVKGHLTYSIHDVSRDCYIRLSVPYEWTEEAEDQEWASHVDEKKRTRVEAHMISDESL